MDGLPPGVRFNPTDEEAIKYYLLPKALGQPLPWHGVLEKDIYGEHSDPWKIFMDQDHWWVSLGCKRSYTYVFTKLSRLRGKMTKRTAGSGTWHGNTKVNVKNQRGQTIGVKRTLKFLPEVVVDMDYDAVAHSWIMHEYSLADVSLRGIKSTDYVICRITKENLIDPPAISSQDSHEIRDSRKRKAEKADNNSPAKKVCCQNRATRNQITEPEPAIGIESNPDSLILEPINHNSMAENPCVTSMCYGLTSCPQPIQILEPINHNSMAENPCVTSMCYGLTSYPQPILSPGVSSVLSSEEPQGFFPDLTFLKEDIIASFIENVEFPPILEGELQVILASMEVGSSPSQEPDLPSRS